MGSVYKKAKAVYIRLVNDLALWLLACHILEIKAYGVPMKAGYGVMASRSAC